MRTIIFLVGFLISDAIRTISQAPFDYQKYNSVLYIILIFCLIGDIIDGFRKITK